MAHANARLTPFGRQLIIQRVRDGWSQALAAESAGVSRSTVAKWCKRYKQEGVAGLRDRSSRPRNSPHALTQDVVDSICRLRRELGAGPHLIAAQLSLPVSTVYGVLKRAGLNLLAHLDRTTRVVIRYERVRAGELVHLDIKKLGRIPDGGGPKRLRFDWPETHSGPNGRGGGSDYMHVAIDDHSRFAYVEALPDEKAATAAGFLERAVAAFSKVGIRVERILTDNGACYRSHLFADKATSLGIQRRFTRPYRPQTNGKAEAFNKTLQREWAYRRLYNSNAERLVGLGAFLTYYNYERPHTGIGNKPPASRLSTTS